MSDRDHLEIHPDDDLEPSGDAFAAWGDEDPDSMAGDLDTMENEPVYESSPYASLVEAELAADGGFAADAEEEDEEPQFAVARRRGLGLHPATLSILMWLTVIVGSAGLGWGVLTAFGVAPARLLAFGSLVSSLAGISDIQANPANLFWLIAGGVVLLALLAATSCGLAISRLRRRAAAAEANLDRIAALRLDDEAGWLDEEFREDPRFDAFVTRNLGAHRLLHAKLTRYIGQDGELHRLERALVDGARNDLTGTYESSSVASLADEVTRQFDTTLHTEQGCSDISEKLRAGGSSMNQALLEACQWNSATLDQISVQGAALERISMKVNKLGELAQNLADAEGDDGPNKLLEDVRKLAASLAADKGSADVCSLQSLTELVDRVSKLAFQIAMEVARLGSRGERLLPMTQKLEELTTEFRQFSSHFESGGGVLGQIGGSLREIGEKISSAGGEDVTARRADSRSLSEKAREIAPLARQTGEMMIEVARGFNQQTDRLKQLGESCARLTGAPWKHEASDRTSDPVAPVEESDDLGVERFDPFEQGGAKELSAVADPFASAPASPFGETTDGDQPRPDLVTTGNETVSLDDSGAGILNDSPAEADHRVGDASGEGEESSLDVVVLDPFGAAVVEESAAASATSRADGGPVASALEFEAAISAAQEETSGESTAATKGGPAIADTGSRGDETGLPSATDRVYDLSDFGAVPVPDEEETGSAKKSDDDRIFDLSDFSAVPVPDDEETGSAKKSDDDRIFDLSEFGAELIS